MKTLTPSLLTILLTTALFAQTPSSKPPAATTAPTAGRDLLRTSLRFLQQLPAFHTKATAKLVLPEGMGDAGMGEIPAVRVDVRYALPARFAVHIDEPFFTNMVCDGERLLRSDAHFALYAEGKAPQPALAFFTAPAKPEWADLPGLATMAQLLLPAGGTRALVDATQVEVLAAETVGDVACHHLAVRDAGLQCELWVQQGAEPYVRRHRPSRAGKPAAGEPEAPPKLVYEVQFAEIGKVLAPDAFAIVAPRGATKVDDLDAAIDAKVQAKLASAGERGPHASIGKPVPAVELKLLSGESLKLADLQGKVVVLDFGATWCGPCVQGLPKVAEITAKRRERGLVFVAIDVGETQAVVEAFLAKKALQVPVALGGDTLGPQFGVAGIPHTVVVGRDGVVRAVNIGFGAGAEQELEVAIDAALAAK